MKRIAYRLTSNKFLHTAFDGEGAKLYGGRWNSVGTRMVYTASSLSLATLELLVHIDDISAIDGRYSVVPIEFDDALVETVADSALPPDWNSAVPRADTQMFGDRWIHGASSVILQVPSAVISTEKNYLINPMHRDFAKVTVEPSHAFRLDPRLVR